METLLYPLLTLLLINAGVILGTVLLLRLIRRNYGIHQRPGPLAAA